MKAVGDEGGRPPVALRAPPDRPASAARRPPGVRCRGNAVRNGRRRSGRPTPTWGEAADPDGPDGPGLVILNSRWAVQSATPGVDRWLDELPDGDMSAGAYLPPCWPSPVRPCVVPRTLDEPSVASPSPECCRATAAGSSCTARDWSTAANHGSPSLSNPLIRRGSMLVSAYRLTD